MPGIAGIFNLRGAPPDHALMEKMLGAIAHRGGGGQGLLLDGAIGLGQCFSHSVDLQGNNNLASIDDGDFSIVFDGQIFNKPELIAVLEQRGYSPQKQTDEELVLHSYKEWGFDCGSHFNGDWAFAIWDRRKNQLFCCRDRAGNRPLVYYSENGLFVFASEIKALLVHPGVPKRVNEEAAFNFLMWDISKIPGSTFFENIHELEPGHYAIIDSEGINRHCWWNPSINLDSQHLSRQAVSNSIEQFRFLLEDSLKLRLARARKPFGIALSGGLESSSIAAIIRQIKGTSPGEPLRTFSCCFDDKKIDERPYIEQTVKMTGAASSYVFPAADRFWEELPSIISWQDEPCAIYSAYARWRLMKAVNAAGIKVLFDGDGGDAVLGGHAWLFGNYALELALRADFTLLSRELLGASSNIGPGQLAHWIGDAAAGALLSRVDPVKQSRIRSLLFRLRHRSTDRIINPGFDARNALAGMAELNLRYGISAGGLNRVLGSSVGHFPWHPDALAAPCQVEVFTPFWDRRLVEYVFSLPPQMKIHNGWTKWILRQAISGIVPEEIRMRPRKNGFEVPLSTWMIANRNPITRFFELENGAIGSYLDGKKIAGNFDQLLSRQVTVWELWRYINFALWLTIYF